MYQSKGLNFLDATAIPTGGHKADKPIRKPTLGNATNPVLSIAIEQFAQSVRYKDINPRAILAGFYDTQRYFDMIYTLESALMAIPAALKTVPNFKQKIINAMSRDKRDQEMSGKNHISMIRLVYEIDMLDVEPGNTFKSSIDNIYAILQYYKQTPDRLVKEGTKEIKPIVENYLSFIKNGRNMGSTTESERLIFQEEFIAFVRMIEKLHKIKIINKKDARKKEQAE